MVRLYIALIHYPVKNRNGDVIASAVTNLDLHDMARVAKTYGVEQFYVVTPLTDQLELVDRITDHWLKGIGAQYNPDRKAALQLIKTVSTLEQAVMDIHQHTGMKPETVATCARYPGSRHQISHHEFRQLLIGGTPYLLMFGTAWGLENRFIDASDHILMPIDPGTGYNHLSVRSAASILLDRLLGDR